MSVARVLQSQTAPLRVVFTRAGDRLAHTIERRAAPVGEEWVAVAASIEGTAEEVWPASPPFQELHIEQHGKNTPGDGSPVAFLVGRAGKSHWSASVTFVGDELVFDVACRIHETPGQIGSLYRSSGALLSLRAEPPAQVSRSETAPDSPIAIFPGPFAADPPFTIRWRYRVVS